MTDGTHSDERRGGWLQRLASAGQSLFAWPSSGKPEDRRASHRVRLTEDHSAALGRRIARLPRRPLLSFVVPARDAPRVALDAGVLSVLDQPYPEVELIVAIGASPHARARGWTRTIAKRDARIRVVRPEAGGGTSVAINEGLAAATGEFVVLMNPGAELVPEAAVTLVERILREPDIDAWYSDEASLDENGAIVQRSQKPDWSPTLAVGSMFVGHLLAVRAELLGELKLDPGLDGAERHDILLRLSERSDRIGHIPEILVTRPRSSAAAQERDDPAIETAQRLAAEAHVRRRGRTWRLEPVYGRPRQLAIRASSTSSEPRVSIVIPSRNEGELIERCLQSLFALTDYEDFEVIVVDGRTTDPVARAALAKHPIRRILYDLPFEGSGAGNRGAAVATGEFLFFLANGAEVTSSDWLRDLVVHFEDPAVGAVGPMLLRPDGTAAQSNFAPGMWDDRGVPGHPPSDGLSACSREVSALSAAALMVRRALFEEIGGFSTDYVARFQDIDLCLEIRERGHRVISASEPRLIRHETTTGLPSEDDLGDRALFLDRWFETIEAGDPYVRSSPQTSKSEPVRGGDAPGTAGRL